MSKPAYTVRRLAVGDSLDAFDCGEPAYNTWLSQHASASVSAGICAVYLLIETGTGPEPGAGRVVGYYAINPTQVVRDAAPASITRGWPQAIPAWKLGKLAVHRDLRADGKAQWGRQLLRDALETIVRVAGAGGGKVIVVDADNPGLLDFYTRNGFTPAGNGLSLFMKVSTARKALASRGGQIAGAEG